MCILVVLLSIASLTLYARALAALRGAREVASENLMVDFAFYIASFSIY